MIWTPEATETLRSAARRGLSGADIAREILRLHGTKVTRSAVIGKAWRIGVSLRGKIVCPQTEARRRASGEFSRRAVEMAFEGYTTGEIANALKACRKNVQRVLKLTRDRGVAVPYNGRKPGRTRCRKPKLLVVRDETRERVRELLKEAPIVEAGTHDEGRYQALSRAAVNDKCEPVSLLDLTPNCCRWPMAGGFCGREKHTGSYCREHASLGYRRAPEVKDSFMEAAE